ncbi:MAG: beta-glucosidase BglX [Bacteroidales bacterium]
MNKYIATICALPIFLASCVGSSLSTTEQRIEDLLSEMTLDEKIGQMNQVTGMGLHEDMKSMVRTGKVGTILNELDVNTVNELQRIAVEESRLGIPLVIARDVIHGFKTIFPIPLAQAASWNPELAKLGAEVAAKEATSVGIRWTFSPMVDVSRDPRWGRIAESYGEDPYLVSVMGAATIKGYQGDDLTNPATMAACAKHFAAYGATESGKDYNTTWVPELQLRETYLPPFLAAVEAGSATFMCSFNDINGVPSSGNQYLNNTILRDEWGYDGVLVSDWGSIEQMIPHGFCADLNEAACKAANASVDIDMMSYAYVLHLSELVNSGKVDEKVVDDAVRNILRMKINLGLFENPYTEVTEGEDVFYTESSMEAAKQAAIESAVLLKNDNKTLPLSTKRVKRIAVVGPLADAPADQVGTWCFDAEAEHSITPINALRDKYGKDVKIDYIPTLTYSRDNSKKDFSKAIVAAKRADVVIIFAGEESVLSGEARCRAEISLPGAQSELIEALSKTKTPVVTVIMAGRPLTIEEEVKNSDAVLLQFHGGTMAGPALAELLFGEVSPSGKLPVTFPKMVGQVPIYYAHKNTGRPASNITLIDDIAVGAPQTSLGFTSYHLDAGDSPLFPFGYGLSYAEFDYSAPKLSSNSIVEGETITVTCDVRNIGNCDAKEVVQLYVCDEVGSLIRPVKELKQFEKVEIKAGETKTVSFTLSSDDLAYWNSNTTKLPEKGAFKLWIASDSNSGVSQSFELK